MTPVQWAGFAVFVASVGWVYAALVFGFVRGALERRGRAPPPSPLRRKARRGVRVLAGVGALCFLYGRLVEPYWPETTHTRVESQKLAAGSAPIRLVHLSDIHSDAVERLEGRLPGLVEAERPDLIVFT